MFLFYFACKINCTFDCVLDMENAVFLGHMGVKCPRIVQKIKKREWNLQLFGHSNRKSGFFAQFIA